MRMKHFLLTSAVVLGAAALAGADEPKKTPPSKPAQKSVAEQIKAVEDALNDKRQELIKQYQAAKDQAEKDKVLQQFNDLKESSSKQYMEIVREHPEDAAAFQALHALLMSEKYGDEAVQLVLKHHLQHKEIGQICLTLGMSRSKGAEKLLRAVAEKGANDEARASATLALGQLLKGNADQAGVAPAERTRLRKEAEKNLKIVEEKYPAVTLSYFGKAGDKARTELFELHHLSVGMEVPDLQGEDLDGKTFKLSDYRGKVVFLDFWAHW
jgi:outer membrane murein-binding lipoprotein Lpp